MKQLNQSILAEAIESTGFGTIAVKYALDPRFQRFEVDYKKRLATALKIAIDAIRSDDPVWLEVLRTALQSADDNIIYWRLRGPFLEWCQNDRAAAAIAIRSLCDDAKPVAERLEGFGTVLGRAGFTQLGQHLCIGSVLLMGTDADSNPPIRARVITKTLAKLELPKATLPQHLGERYSLFISILDGLVSYSASSGRRLASRLEAQGAVWCVVEEWDPDPPLLDSRTLLGDVDEMAEEDLQNATSDLRALNQTERTAVVAARRGQGRYRRDLLRLWIGCSVTGCVSEALLRASHLKPWRHSSNLDRLNQYNGLLLTPNLDHALDRCLITFADDGSLLTSAALAPEDAVALGIHHGLKLRFVRPQHKPFLAYHRSLFERLDALFIERR